MWLLGGLKIEVCDWLSPYAHNIREDRYFRKNKEAWAWHLAYGIRKQARRRRQWEERDKQYIPRPWWNPFVYIRILGFVFGVGLMFYRTSHYPDTFVLTDQKLAEEENDSL